MLRDLSIISACLIDGLTNRYIDDIESMSLSAIYAIPSRPRLSRRHQNPKLFDHVKKTGLRAFVGPRRDETRPQNELPRPRGGGG